MDKMPAYLEELAFAFSMLPSKREVLIELIELGKSMQELPVEERTAERKVPGCVSNVYIKTELDATGKIIFMGSADALIVKGYVALLVQSLSGYTAREIVEEAGVYVDAFLKKTDLNASMIASRANAFGNIFQTMKEQCKAFL